jgi:hypothetical protein
MMNWEGFRRKWSWPKSMCYPGICLQELRNKKKESRKSARWRISPWLAEWLTIWMSKSMTGWIIKEVNQLLSDWMDRWMSAPIPGLLTDWLTDPQTDLQANNSPKPESLLLIGKKYAMNPILNQNNTVHTVANDLSNSHFNIILSLRSQTKYNTHLQF